MRSSMMRVRLIVIRHIHRLCMNRANRFLIREIGTQRQEKGTETEGALRIGASGVARRFMVGVRTVVIGIVGGMTGGESETRRQGDGLFHGSFYSLYDYRG